MRIIIKLQSEMPLAGDGPAQYRGIASDGCSLFLIKPEIKEIARLDSHFREAECFPTRRSYACLCYDPGACCFWASDGRRSSVLYKLDESFREVDRITVRNLKTGEETGVITGISYEQERKCLLLATASGLVWASVGKDGAMVIGTQKTDQWVTCAVAAGRSWFYCHIDDGKQMVRYCSARGKTLWECCVPKGLYVDSMVFARSPKECGACRLYVLASKHSCYPYLLECVPACDAFSPEFCCVCKPKPPCPDPKPPCPDPKPPCPGPKPPCPGPKPPCPGPKPPCPGPKPHPDPESCEEVLKSVATVQTALSQVLNAEGEKLRKAIAATDDPNVLLKLNEAANRTLIDATFLEQALYYKLELLQDICGPSEPEPDGGPSKPEREGARRP